MTQEVFVFPLSFSQQRLWFLDRLMPGNPFYNTDAALHLRGRLDLGALRSSVDEVVRRHETLRTTFAAVDGQPLQVIAPSLSLEVPVTDLTALPRATRGAEGARLAAAEVRRPFDLARGPLLRLRLLRWTSEEAVLLVTVHHIACDAWSMDVLAGELERLYAAFSAGRSPALPELPVQYADFAVWQRQWLRGEELERQLGYWRSQLADLPELRLPTDRPRPAVPSFRGASRLLALPEPLSAALQAMSRRAGTTLFMTLLAAFQTLLCRYTGQDDVVVGSPIANRTRAELEGLIGFFVNTLVLRTGLFRDPPFTQVQARVREVALGAYAHQDVPFERLVEELQPERDLSRNPLFQVTFQLQTVTVPERDAAAADRAGAASLPPLANESAKFDVAASFWEVPKGLGGLGGRFEYSTDLFDAGTIERFTGHFATLLAGIVADPEARLSDLPLLTAPEREQLLETWNATAGGVAGMAGDAPQACLHEIFALRAAQNPESPAVVGEGAMLTYRELDRLANRLACRLRALGVGPEVVVGVFLERSPWLVAGLLAILKAGGAYLPLDPAHPPDRLPVTGARALCLDDGEAAGAGAVDSAPVSGAGPRNLAYVLYTSGSTGRPKGVLVEHRSLANYLVWIDDSLLVARGIVLPAIASLSFDASLKQLLAPLLRGAAVWLLPEEVVLQPDRLLAALGENPAAGLNCVPSLWKAVLDAVDSGQAQKPAAGPRAVLLGGEKLSRELVERSARTFPGLELWNLYGPTEATANACAARVPPAGEPSIGRPIAGARGYVLDRHGQPVPVGVPGELHLGGPGVARGYLGRPERTAERFLPDAFSGEPGARLLKTGDRVRRRADGELSFLGRLDDQLKLRGVRLEPAEIEAAVAAHPAVQACAVAVREPSPGDPLLVAYLVLRQSLPGSAVSPVPATPATPETPEIPEIDELGRFLRQRLPAAWVPSAFVALPVLPRLPSGKVDRAALPDPGSARPALGTAYVPARNRLERCIAGLWREVLQLARLGVHDNFFDLGGRSLLLVRVQGRLCELLRREISMIDLFRHPTVAALARHLGGGQREPRERPAFRQAQDRARLQKGAAPGQKEPRARRKGGGR